MSKYSSVKSHNIKNGVITMWITPNSVKVELDSQILNYPIYCWGETIYDALNTLHAQVESTRVEVFHFYMKLCAAGAIKDYDLAKKEYLHYRQLLDDVYEVKKLYTK